MVQVNAPKTAKTFGEYGKVGIALFANLCATTWHSVCYFSEGVSQKRNPGRAWQENFVSLSIKENTPTYRKFAKILKLDDNNIELCNHIADTLPGILKNQQKDLLITQQQTVLSSRTVGFQRLQPC